MAMKKIIDWKRCGEDMGKIYDPIRRQIEQLCSNLSDGIESSVISLVERPPHVLVNIAISETADMRDIGKELRTFESELTEIAQQHDLWLFDDPSFYSVEYKLKPDYNKY